ncbi:MAG TPA: PAS domain S-box protein, partial [Rhodospirillales bacterium]|nr:PAS domain S-box protein [Rhodospirillales bacterium]
MQQEAYMPTKPARNKKFLQTILETVPNGILSIDENGDILSLNPKAELIFGYTEKEALGMNITVLMPKPARMEHKLFIRIHMKKSGP